MRWEVRISYKKGVQDSEGDSTKQGLKTLGFDRIEKVGSAKVFVIDGGYQYDEIEEMCKRLLANPVSQDYQISEVNG